MPEPTPYIPYKHITLIAVLAIIMLYLYAYQDEVILDENILNEPAENTLVEIPETDGSPITPPLIAPSVIAPSAIALSPVTPSSADIDNTSVNALVSATETPTPENKPPPPPPKTEDKVIVSDGDTLSVLFDRYNLGQTALRHILSADESLLELETLRPKQVLFFRYKENTSYLTELELYKHPAHRVIYRRTADNAFSYEVIRQKGEWHIEQVGGTITGSFYLSAQRAGLREGEAATVTRIFKEQLNFSRSIQKGDKFQIVRSVQTIDGQPTGQTRIDSARIQRHAHEHTAFLFDDGRYYDKQGQSLARAFTRKPLIKSYRISSPFNLRRKHPVTGRIGPHNGTDFATPKGTKVISTGDGVVSRVGNHPYAGRYIDIQHGGQYKTRYLHLDRILVRKGESVTRGQNIALSGNSGRSTGAHLHFELHINGRPVNPMTANIPISRSIPKKHQTTFAQQVAQQTTILDGKG